MIEVKNLTKKYGNHLAVDNISFTLEPGSVYGFLGPNGAGKSTTMNIMTGYIAATSGEVVINGHDILDEPEEAKACIGYLPEIPPLYLEMTVEEYLRFAARLKGIKKKEVKSSVDEVIGLTKLSEYRSRLIMNLSKGYKQRVGLAQAVLGMPEIIILDEPTVGLDPRQIIEIREMIRTLSKKHTIILSSHILQEISAVCDHILIIARGHLVASDTPENLIRQYSDRSQMKLKVKGAIPDVRAVLNRTEGIREEVVPAVSEPDVCEVTLLLEKGADIREELFNGFAEDGLPILNMVTYEPDLEDIFMELTAKEDEKAMAREEELLRKKLEKNKRKQSESDETSDEEAVSASALDGETDSDEAESGED